MSFERDVNNFPASWRGIVEKWSEFNAQYYDQHSDLPAWYVENSNSALFSAAAWVEGHQALCEVDVDKRFYSGSPGRPASYAGRMDIELIAEDQIYWVEAKRRAFSLGRNSNYSFRHAFLAASVNEAYANARQCRPAAKAMNAKIASIVFFSGHIEPEAAEREQNSTPQMRAEMVAEEISLLRENMRSMAKEMGGRLFHSVSSQRDYRIYKDWQGYYWPAAFGLVAVIDE